MGWGWREKGCAGQEGGDDSWEYIATFSEGKIVLCKCIVLC